MRIGFAEGRARLRADDRDGAPNVCIVNESLARHVFPGESALGKMLLRGSDADIKSEIVGVIRDVKTNGLNAPVPDEVYYPMRQLGRAGHERRRPDDGRPGGAAGDHSRRGRGSRQGPADLVLRDARDQRRRPASARSASSRR